MVDLATNWERLDAASIRFTILRMLRRNGGASAAVGAVCLVAGLAPQFTTGWDRRTRHRLGLFPEGAIALLENRQALRFERRQDVEITLHRKAWIGRSVGVSVRMSDLTLKGEMPEENYERFESWRLGMIKPPAFAA